jgi:gamma-glutamyltranspeptidase/glutathione hydrolase
MSSPLVPVRSVRVPAHLVASADQLATQAGLAILARGGNAVDAAIATNAAIAVTAPHQCGMGGDLFALVHLEGEAPAALNASGRAGSGADPDELRAEGHHELPLRHDMRTVTVPGCVDGWVALHERFGRSPLDEVLAPAIGLAEEGFPASPLLVGSLGLVDPTGRERLHQLADQATRPGARVRRPGVARALRAIGTQGAAGFYSGEFGAGLLALRPGQFTESDLLAGQATWVQPLGLDVWGQRLWTIPPNSQGYLALASAWIAEGLRLPTDPDDPAWAHLLIEAALVAGYDRPDVLHEHADGWDLLAPERLLPRRDGISTESTSNRPRRHLGQAGDTTYLCVVDRDRMGVSLIQSNASGFGSWLVEPSTGINLHNRGLGFSLQSGHPAEYGPGRRPPHTLSPLLVTSARASLVATIGTMGGDAQPQILLQLLARLFGPGRTGSAAEAIAAGRWVLHGRSTGFDTWTSPGGPDLRLEGHTPAEWDAELTSRGHRVTRSPAFDSGFGHAHVILVDGDGHLSGAADPRAVIGSAAGL